MVTKPSRFSINIDAAEFGVVEVSDFVDVEVAPSNDVDDVEVAPSKDVDDVVGDVEVGVKFSKY